MCAADPLRTLEDLNDSQAMRILPAATILSIGTVAFLALAVPRLYTGFQEREIRRELQAATPGDTLDQKVAAALDDGDISLAVQFAGLAEELGKPLSAANVDALAAAQTPLASALRNAGDFAGAYITGHADSAAGLAGAVVSDLTVVGDVRDIVREGGKAAIGEDYSQFLLGLAAVGLAAEGVTLATGGASLTVKAAVSVLKVAKRTGNITVDFASSLVRLGRTAARSADAPAGAALAATRATGGMTPVRTADQIAAARRGETAATGSSPAARTTGRTTAGDASADLTPAAARAELTTTLSAVGTMATNAGPAEAVKLMRTVRHTGDATELATFTGRFGARSRAVAELTGKTSLRAFRAAVRGVAMLIAFLYSLAAWAAGLLAVRLVKGVVRTALRAVVSLFRGAFVALALP